MAATKKVKDVDSVPKKTKKPEYRVNLKVNDTESESSGDTVLEALDKLLIPGFVKTESVFTFFRGSILRIKVLGVFDARRLFGSHTSLEIFASDMSKQLG